MNDEPEIRRNPMWIVGINLLVLIGYTIICRLTALNARGEDALGSILILAFLIGAHVLFCLLFGIASPKNTKH